ncbi:efflux RND transporter periplasmic adaptor subunit [Haemophilus paracuniculus]|uniref:efflux RND transporter periplasmic adaptor subunit n=1 Tax=Haemophilus paracuniculus TaxID=734 RepID=UPI001FE7B5C5|nr:efflux RND transporter periplasmic adaptor subunit [Haemophilus paracuniculus]
MQQTNASLGRAKANVNAQQAVLSEAEITLKRYQTLMKSESISQLELDQQRTKVATARANLQSAQAEVAQIQAQLKDNYHQRNKAQVLAPADGVITKRNLETGALTSSTPLFHLAKDNATELEVEIRADEMALLQTGLTAQLKNQPETSGQIRLIFPELDPKTRLGKVRVAFPASLKQPIGAFDEVKIALPTQNVPFAVPFSAITFGANGQPSVMIVTNDGKIERRSIQIGSQNQDWVEVLAGLNREDNVVKQAAAFVSEGDTVSPQLVKE